jgi:hypothetical protein
MLTLLSLLRLLYLSHQIHSVEDGFGEALNPLNECAMLAVLFFGPFTVLCLIVAGIGQLFVVYDRKHPLPGDESKLYTKGGKWGQAAKPDNIALLGSAENDGTIPGMTSLIFPPNRPIARPSGGSSPRHTPRK